MHHISRLIVPAPLSAAAFAAPASAKMAAPDTAIYLMKAGASDKFEIAEARVM